MAIFRCDMCNSPLIEEGIREVADTPYMILKCNKCNKKIIKRLESLDL